MNRREKRHQCDRDRHTSIILCPYDTVYKVIQKTGYPDYFRDNFGNSAPILTIFFTVTSRN